MRSEDQRRLLERGGVAPRRTSKAMRRAGAAVVAVLALAALGDHSRPASRQIGVRLVVRCLGMYQQRVSPQLRSLGVRCRFRPSCSEYAREVLLRRGLIRGGAAALWRLLRCGPWTRLGTVDLPPGAGSGQSRERSRRARRASPASGRSDGTRPQPKPQLSSGTGRLR